MEQWLRVALGASYTEIRHPSTCAVSKVVQRANLGEMEPAVLVPTIEFMSHGHTPQLVCLE
jgi:hypothetical protein